MMFGMIIMTALFFCLACLVAISLSVKFATHAPDQNPIFHFPALVRALFGQRSPAHAANGQFKNLSAHCTTAAQLDLRYLPSFTVATSRH